MPIRPHSDSVRLKAAIQRCLRVAIPWTGTVYRTASVRYANRDDLLTGAGSKQDGARWNPPGSVATLYTSLEIQTAIEETLAHNRYYGFPEETALPRVLVAIQTNLQFVLNLTESRTRRRLGVSRDQLLREDWRAANDRSEEALTQAIGRLAWDAECERLLVPAVADPGGVNLVIFPGNLTPPGSYLLIINRNQLPPRF
jgi:RES domain-containing protein